MIVYFKTNDIIRRVSDMREKDERKYEAICNASIDLINEAGFAHASMSKIAKRAGVAAATIYIYFENKEDLLNKLYLRVHRSMSVKIISTELDSSSIENAMKTIWMRLYKVLIGDKRSFLFIEQFIHSPLINEIAQQEVWGYFDVIDKIIEMGVTQKIVKEGIDNELLCSFTFGSVIDLVKKHHAGRFIMTDSEVTLMLDMAWGSMKK